MTRTRRLLMVAFVATALSADRVAHAAPVLRPQVIDTARQLAGRLVVNLRRTVPSARLLAFRREERVTPSARVFVPDRGLVIHLHELSPFQFRLPPPML